MVETDIQINTKELITKKKKDKRKKNTVLEYEIETKRDSAEWNEMYDN